MLPLKDIRILDMSRVLSGPYATMVLADLGADVIKVEHPERGDDTRHWGPPFAGDQSAYFLSVNRNKRSIALDLKTPEGIEKIKHLVPDTDVVIQNMRRGALDELGLGYEELQQLNPEIIYCSITGFGPGPDEYAPGYDFLVQARSGIMSMTGQPDGEPTKVGVAVADINCGLQAATAILAAVHRRDVTGQGAHLEVPLFESQLSWLANRAQEYLVSGEDKGRMGNSHPTIVPYQTFHASDKVIAVAVGNDAQFAKLCVMVGLEEEARDSRYATNSDRIANRESLVRELQAEFSKRPAEEWIKLARDSGLPCGPVNSIVEVFNDAHVIESGIVQDVDHPTAGSFKMLSSPIILDNERLPIRLPPPTLGQHNHEADYFER